MNQDLVLAWFAATGRDLPWRRTRDPWAILVAEVMLQQTQVARVSERWPAFLELFPTPAATASAGLGAVLERWQGLGYNRRAKALHDAAVAVVERHGGRLPDDLAELLALPGVGPYTARAVLAFAFERDVAVIDVNVARVLARSAAGRRLGPKEAQALADALVPAGEGWAWNQALLDLGARCCTKRAPACGVCPVLATCAWRRGDPAGGGDDPAVGSFATGAGKTTFEGSDRQGRGRLMDAVRRGGIDVADLAAAMGWPDDAERASRVAEGLLREGLVERDGARLRLPG